MVELLYGVLCGLMAIALTTCAVEPQRPVTKETAARKLSPREWPSFADDMDIPSLRSAIENSLGYFQRVPQDTVFQFGQDTYPVAHMRQSSRRLLECLTEDATPERFRKLIKEQYDVYQAVGVRGDGDMLFTGYYEPIVDVDKLRSDNYFFPIHLAPPDRIIVDLDQFLPDCGRSSSIGRLLGNRVVPYYTHSEIVAGALDNQNLVIAYAKSRVDVFFMQVQGSGMIRYPDGSHLSLGYAGGNGHPYVSIGRILIEQGLLQREEMSMGAIRSYFDSYPEQIDRILSQNPSYVFFRVIEGGPFGNISVELTPGRSIATDARLFPKGAFAYIRSQKPVIGSGKTPAKWIDYGRFVCNQDTGGAIKGPGRVDVFWGNGPYAEVAAGFSCHRGNLYFLVMKKSVQ